MTATHVVWRTNQGVPKKPSILLKDDLLFMINDVGIVTCLEAKTGQVVWKSRLKGTYSASPILTAGRIYVFDEDGKTTVLEAGREFKVLAENQLDDGFMASPAVAGRALFLRTRTHLYRIEEMTVAPSQRHERIAVSSLRLRHQSPTDRQPLAGITGGKGKGEEEKIADD